MLRASQGRGAPRIARGVPRALSLKQLPPSQPLDPNQCPLGPPRAACRAIQARRMLQAAALRAQTQKPEEAGQRPGEPAVVAHDPIDQAQVAAAVERVRVIRGKLIEQFRLEHAPHGIR